MKQAQHGGLSLDPGETEAGGPSEPSLLTWHCTSESSGQACLRTGEQRRGVLPRDLVEEGFPSSSLPLAVEASRGQWCRKQVEMLLLGTRGTFQTLHDLRELEWNCNSRVI